MLALLAPSQQQLPVWPHSQHFHISHFNAGLGLPLVVRLMISGHDVQAQIATQR